MSDFMGGIGRIRAAGRDRAKKLGVPGVSVPETTVYEQTLAILRKHYVGTTRQITPVQTEPVPEAVRYAPNTQFGGCVPPSHRAHEGAPGFLRPVVHLTTRYASQVTTRV